MNTINEKRIAVLRCIFPDEIETTRDPFSVHGDDEEEELQVSLEQRRDSLKVAILSFDVPVYSSEFNCLLTKVCPPNSHKSCAGKFSDDSLFINDISH